MSRDMRLDSRGSQTEDDDLGQIPADHGIYARYQDALNKVLKKGNTMDERFREEMEIKLFHLAVSGDLDRMRQLVENGISVNAVDYNGRSPLHLAADRGFTEVVEYLLSNSATPDLKDNRGDSAVTLASKANHADTVLVLQRAGAGDPQQAAAAIPAHAPKPTRCMQASFAVMEAFPHSIAAAMLDGRRIAPITKDNVSLLFSDIVGFTALSGAMPADRVSAMLNRLFKKFDRLAHLHGVQKIDVV
eukprot:CAMPEP_0172200544 /NCGR_PEP_ID=MMETSP1050-20130122/29399_1 /TAXON_ID=233186 /ORGANISM="Cryptomonas curvata, Strain CCAP979/52" /LENGTH=245 /DNA_ID=CAMNT_0012877883 /DNA_START=112 /DNA_END=845 /DNA_ORIENTATION=+